MICLCIPCTHAGGVDLTSIQSNLNITEVSADSDRRLPQYSHLPTVSCQGRYLGLHEPARRSLALTETAQRYTISIWAASASATRQRSSTGLLAHPHRPMRERVAIERSRTIRIALIPANTILYKTETIVKNYLHIYEAMRDRWVMMRTRYHADAATRFLT
jgi:hypothetical protein